MKLPKCICCQHFYCDLDDCLCNANHDLKGIIPQFHNKCIYFQFRKCGLRRLTHTMITVKKLTYLTWLKKANSDN